MILQNLHKLHLMVFSYLPSYSCHTQASPARLSQWRKQNVPYSMFLRPLWPIVLLSDRFDLSLIGLLSHIVKKISTKRKTLLANDGGYASTLIETLLRKNENFIASLLKLDLHNLIHTKVILRESPGHIMSLSLLALPNLRHELRTSSNVLV